MRGIRLRISVDRDLALAALCAGILLVPLELATVETVTLNVNFPTPNAVYKGILTTGANPATGNTVLNVNGGNTILIPSTNAAGRVGIGVPNGSALNEKLHVAGIFVADGYITAGTANLGGDNGSGTTLYGFNGTASDLNLRSPSNNFEVRNAGGGTTYLKIGATSGPGGVQGASIENGSAANGAFAITGTGANDQVRGLIDQGAACGAPCKCSAEDSIPATGRNYVIYLENFYNTIPTTTGNIRWCGRFRG